MQTAEVTFDGVVSQCVEVTRSRIGLVLGTIFLITAGFSLVDLAPTKGLNFIPNLIVSLYVQYYFVETMLSDNIATSQRRKRRYGSLFYAGFLGGLGVLAGTILLIIPGIFLLARWSMSTPFIVAEGMSGSEALGASWEASSAARWIIFSVLLVCIATLALLFGAAVFVTAFFNFNQDGFGFSAAINFLASLWVVGGWTLGVGIYRCLRPASNALAEVFA